MRQTSRGTHNGHARSVVDDDESMQCCQTLRQLGYVKQGLTWAEAFLCSDIVSETNVCTRHPMPGMSGPELQQEPASEAGGSDCVHHRTERRLRLRVIARGAVECLFKPFSEAALIDALNSRFFG
jgi:FixJ family two-component response regulator